MADHEDQQYYLLQILNSNLNSYLETSLISFLMI